MTVTIEMLLALVAGSITLLGFWFGIVRWVSTLFRQRDDAIAQLRRDFDDYKLSAADKYATSHELAEHLGRIENALTALTTRFDRYFDRQGGRPGLETPR